MSNLILNTLKPAKKTIVKFLGSMVDPINSLTYGLGSDNIDEDLKLQEKLKKSNETTFTEGNEQFPGVLSKDKYDDTNREIGNEQQKLLKAKENPLKNPGVIPITKFVRKLNSFPLCNPLEVGINAAFPPGSPIATGLSNIQNPLKQIQNIFTSFRLIEGNQVVTGTSIPQPIAEGEFTITIPGPDILSPGTNCFIQQMNDDTIFTNMLGVVKSSTAEPSTEKPIKTQPDPVDYVIEIQRFDPFDPPKKKSKSGNTVLDNGVPVLATFTTWEVTYETELTTDIKELAESIESVTSALREIGFNEVINTFNQIPDSFLKLGNIKKTLREIDLFINNNVLPEISNVSNITSTASQTLSGGLTSKQVIDRSKVFTKFYNEIKPLIAFDLSLQNIFKSQIQDINKVLRGAIPYDQLAKLVGTIIKFTKFVTNTVNFVLGIFQFLNVLVKTLLIVVKVFRVLIKVIAAVANALPTMFATAGIVNILGKVVIDVGVALDFAEAALNEISGALDDVINSLMNLRRYLKILTSELAKMQQTFETCANLDGRKNMNLNGAIQGLVSAATGVPFPDNTVRTQLEETFGFNTPNDKFDNGQEASELSQFGNTLVTTADGTILVLPGTVWGFDLNGQIIFGGDLISLATGVNFEETRGQIFRKMLRDNFNFYTFNKFKGANNADLVGNLEAQSIELYAKQVEDARNKTAGDKFGNFQEVYLGYTIRIQEEKPTSDTSKGESKLVRRRGVAFSIDESLVAASDLTFSDDLNLIVNETKYRIRRNVQQGIIGVGTVNNQNLPDEDAVRIAETTGANPLAISNIKAQANNRNANSIDGGSGGQINTDPVAIRTGNSPFEEAGGEPATIVSNQSSPNKTINTNELIKQPFADFIEENPSLKKMQDTFKLLQGASTSQLNDIMSAPGVFDLNGEELAEKLKNNIVSSINPNPEHVEEITNKTTVWLEGLKETTKMDYEQIVLNMHPTQRAAYPPFEVYYDSIEPEEFDKWIKFLLSKDYTQEEILSGVKEESLRDEYKIKFDQKGKGGKILKVVISRRNQRLRDQINK